MNPSTYLLLALIPIGIAAMMWAGRTNNDWSVLVGFLGIASILFGIALPGMAWFGSVIDERHDALEGRYGITIDRASLSMTGEPEPWRINGKWYTCYVEKSKTPGERFDLFCASPVEDYRSADFISSAQ